MNSRAVVLSAFATGFLTLGAPAPARQCSQTESFQLYASDGFQLDLYGRDVDVSEDWIVVGAADQGFNPNGSAYVYTRGPFFQEIKLDPPAPGISGGFGSRVEIDGNLLVVSEIHFDQSRGRVHVYQYAGGLWALMQTIEGAPEDAYFGAAVSIDAAAGLIAIGARYSESVRIYGLASGAWSLLRKLTPLLPGQFGASVCLDGNRLAVGAPYDGNGRGAVYVYEGSGILWALKQKLIHAETDADDLFGNSVSMEGDDLLIGAPGLDFGGVEVGSAFTYARAGDVWVAGQRLDVPFPMQNDRMGWDVELDGDVAVVSCAGAIAPTGAEGLVYQYRKQGSLWVEQQTLYRAIPSASSSFGVAVSVKDGLVVATDYVGTGLVVQAGTVFGFELPDLSLAVSPSSPNVGELIFVDSCGGAPGHPMALFAVGVNGVPVFVNLIPGSFDGQGSFGLFAPYNDPALAGSTIDLQAYGLDASGVVRGSNVESIMFQ